MVEGRCLCGSRCFPPRGSISYCLRWTNKRRKASSGHRCPNPAWRTHCSWNCKIPQQESPASYLDTLRENYEKARSNAITTWTCSVAGQRGSVSASCGLFCATLPVGWSKGAWPGKPLSVIVVTRRNQELRRSPSLQHSTLGRALGPPVSQSVQAAQQAVWNELVKILGFRRNSRGETNIDESFSVTFTLDTFLLLCDLAPSSKKKLVVGFKQVEDVAAVLGVDPSVLTHYQTGSNRRCCTLQQHRVQWQEQRDAGERIPRASNMILRLSYSTYWRPTHVRSMGGPLELTRPRHDPLCLHEYAIISVQEPRGNAAASNPLRRPIQQGVKFVTGYRVVRFVEALEEGELLCQLCHNVGGGLAVPFSTCASSKAQGAAQRFLYFRLCSLFVWNALLQRELLLSTDRYVSIVRVQGVRTIRTTVPPPAVDWKEYVENFRLAAAGDGCETDATEPYASDDGELPIGTDPYADPDASDDEERDGDGIHQDVTSSPVREEPASPIHTLDKSPRTPRDPQTPMSTFSRSSRGGHRLIPAPASASLTVFDIGVCFGIFDIGVCFGIFTVGSRFGIFDVGFSVFAPFTQKNACTVIECGRFCSGSPQTPPIRSHPEVGEQQHLFWVTAPGVPQNYTV
eukprot:g23721.t1